MGKAYIAGKAYMAAGQANACLNTLTILQAYQANMLKDLDERERVDPEAAYLSKPPRRWPQLSASLWQAWWPGSTELTTQNIQETSLMRLAPLVDYLAVW